MVLSGDPVGSKWRPHGDVVYRTDNLGARVGVLPATCFSGEHSLHVVGYRALELESYLKITCLACDDKTSPRADYYWALYTTPPRPDRAELDDAPYKDLTEQIAQRKRRPAPG
nr:hypothetical protein [Kibdelosporangium phytohabitans]